MRHQAQAANESSAQWFATTHWSQVVSAGQPDSSRAPAALEKLCQAYWKPLYSYVRRQGHGPADAQDLTQAFFARFLEKNLWSRANPQKGRFRSFLLTVLRHFLADERDRVRTVKRGGGFAFISFDEKAGEQCFLEGLGENLSGEEQFDRQWASTVLEQARARLRQECIATGKSGLFERVNLTDAPNTNSMSYEAVAQELGMSVSAIKSAVSRLRSRYGELVREEVAHTVSSPAEIDAEIRHLLSVVGG